MLRSFMSALVFAVNLAIAANAGSLRVYETRTEDMESRILRFEGYIETGDAERLRDAITGTRNSPVTSIEFASAGGNLRESLHISAVLNSALIRVTPTRRLESGDCEDEWVTDSKQCGCSSACAIIWMAAVNRSWFGTVGVHRPYMTKQDYSELSSREAQQSYEEMLDWLNEYLVRQQVPVHLIALKFSRSPVDLHVLAPSEQVALPREREFLSEHLEARCLGVAGSAEYYAYQQNLMRAYAHGDTAALLLLSYGKEWEGILNSPYFHCREAELHKMAGERQENPFSIIIDTCRMLPANANWVQELCKPAVPP